MRLKKSSSLVIPNEIETLLNMRIAQVIEIAEN